MTIDDSVNKLLEGGGKSLSWNGAPPIVHIVTVDSAKTQQSTEMGSGKPRFFDSGDPIMDIVVSGYVDQHDGPDDDGLRRLFLKNDAIRALKEALRVAGVKGIGRGGRLAVQYHADEQTKTGTKKLFRAQYEPPSPTQAANDLLGSTPAPSAASAASWAQEGATSAPQPERVDPFLDR